MVNGMRHNVFLLKVADYNIIMMPIFSVLTMTEVHK